MQTIPTWLDSKPKWKEKYLKLRNEARSGCNKRIFQNELIESGNDELFTTVRELSTLLDCSVGTLYKMLRLFEKTELIKWEVRGEGTGKMTVIEVL